MRPLISCFIIPFRAFTHSGSNSSLGRSSSFCSCSSCCTGCEIGTRSRSTHRLPSIRIIMYFAPGWFVFHTVMMMPPLPNPSTDLTLAISSGTTSESFCLFRPPFSSSSSSNDRLRNLRAGYSCCETQIKQVSDQNDYGGNMSFDSPIWSGKLLIFPFHDLNNLCKSWTFIMCYPSTIFKKL